MTTTDKITITSRTRLGFGWSNTPARDAFEIEPDTEPTEFGTLGTLQKTLDYLCRINSGGTWWTWSYYVRVDGVWTRLGHQLSQEILHDLWLHRDWKKAGWSYTIAI
jgi:hypothetical protein